MTHKSYPKTAYVRSKKLMEAYRLIGCQICGSEDGTVCGAHSNWAEHGKGRGIKASDDKCASLCHSCHMLIDQGKADAGLKRRAWDLAHKKTVELLKAKGLWCI